ncbi:hypothetical protein [Embleya sp. AB8]|uniref:hypothetical protein n=1 Tax=Embleya sp. AB8 TaxID=3156304 RepID=UPI003C78AA28
MREQDMKDLMGQAVLGLGPVGATGPVGVDEVFREAARVRRRRRRVLASVGTASAVAAVIGGSTLLLRPAGFTDARGVSAPPTESASPRPGPTGTASATASVWATGSAEPAATETRTGEVSIATASSLVSVAPTVPLGSTADGQPEPVNPSAFVARLLRPDVGDVRKQPPGYLPDDGPHRLSGRYLVTKDGRVGYLDITVNGPRANYGTVTPTTAFEQAHNRCADSGIAVTYTDCAETPLPDGSLRKTWTSPPGQREPASGGQSAGGYGASVSRADGRAVVIQVSAGLIGGSTYGPPLAAPPLDQAELARVVQDSRWYTG